MEIITLNSIFGASKLKPISFGFKWQITKLSFFLIITIFAFSATAQSTQELGQAISTMKLSSIKSVQDESSHINSLVNDLQPTVYINNGTIKTFSNAPYICADVDLLSLGTLIQTNSIFSQVELLKIRINAGDIGSVLNLSNLTSFTNLKYIVFLCSYNCDPVAINNMYTGNSGSGITVFYQISIPN